MKKKRPVKWQVVYWNGESRKKYRKKLFMAAAMFFLVMLLLGYFTLKKEIPDEMYVTDEDSTWKVSDNPLITWEESLPVSKVNQFTLSCSILHTIFLKEVTVHVVEPSYVQVSGSAIGLYMETQGVLIVDTQQIQGEDGGYYDPAENLVQPGDYITACNHEPVTSKGDLIQELKQCKGEEVSLSLRRNGEEIQLSLNPVKCSEEDYKLGIWVRDDTQGIGTLTYVREDKTFGALGHGISDADTGGLLQIKDGQLYETEILGIHKGSQGSPGELSGLIRYEDDNILGEILSNTELGIFGKLDKAEELQLKTMEVAYKQELELGEATILCQVDGEVEEYEIEITKIDKSHSDTNKGFVLKVTDERLLEKTGGIVQGMSGSPVIQNGKFVGAVTHVFVQDSTGGYGIFAETMLDGEK